MIFTLPNTKENRDCLESHGFTIFSQHTLEFEYICPEFRLMYYSGDSRENKETQYGELTQDIIPDLMLLRDHDTRVLYFQSLQQEDELRKLYAENYSK